VLNGAYFRNLRQQAEITLGQMGRICGVSAGQLSKMERGSRRFLEAHAALYIRLFERRRRADCL